MSASNLRQELRLDHKASGDVEVGSGHVTATAGEQRSDPGAHRRSIVDGLLGSAIDDSSTHSRDLGCTQRGELLKRGLAALNGVGATPWAFGLHWHSDGLL